MLGTKAVTARNEQAGPCLLAFQSGVEGLDCHFVYLLSWKVVLRVARRYQIVRRRLSVFVFPPIHLLRDFCAYHCSTGFIMHRSTSSGLIPAYVITFTTFLYATNDINHRRQASNRWASRDVSARL